MTSVDKILLLLPLRFCFYIGHLKLKNSRQNKSIFSEDSVKRSFSSCTGADHRGLRCFFLYSSGVFVDGLHNTPSRLKRAPLIREVRTLGCGTKILGSNYINLLDTANSLTQRTQYAGCITMFNCNALKMASKSFQPYCHKN